MPDLVVIMSVYKNDKLHFVKESVQSILNQTYSHFHYYLIFEGPVSEDVEHYFSSLNDNRISLFRLQINMGLATALNYLLKEILANPEYRFIARMDADDISMPDRFEMQRDFLLKNSEISCGGSWYREIDEDGKQLSACILPTNSEEIKKYYFNRTPFAHASVIYRRSLIEKAGLYPIDTLFIEDNVLWRRSLIEGLRFFNIPEFLFKFRIDKDFFKRKSGLKYGYNYIIAKTKINKSLNSPSVTSQLI